MAEVSEFFTKRAILTNLVEKEEEARDREAGFGLVGQGLRAFAAATGSEVFDKLHAGFAGDLAKQAVAATSSLLSTKERRRRRLFTPEKRCTK